MSETHSDYGRVKGKYLGNVQQHDPVQLYGETQASIAAFFPPWAGADDLQLLVSAAVAVATCSGMSLAELANRPSPSQLDHPLLEGDPAACLAIQLNRFAASRPNYTLDREVNRRMAELRDADSPGPFAHFAEWIADADARKGAGDGQG